MKFQGIFIFTASRAPPVAPDYKVFWIASIYLQHTAKGIFIFTASRAPPVAPDYKVCWIASIYLQHTAIDQSHSRHFKTGVKFPGYIYFHSESGAPSGARLQNMLNSFGICLAYCYWPVAFELFYLLVLSISLMFIFTASRAPPSSARLPNMLNCFSHCLAYCTLL